MMKVCVVTSTRAEYGLLKPVIEKIKEHPKLNLQIIATGTHLEGDYGYTVKEIESDGHAIDRKIKIISGNSPIDIIKTMSSALENIGEALYELMPDIIVIDGDRYEMPPVAMAANVLGIPVAHIGGGDITEGAYDDAFRHTLTKLSSIHFPTTEVYKIRIIQMGEEPERVINVGSTGVENIFNMPLRSKEDLEEQIGFKMYDNTIMVTFHPVTNQVENQAHQFRMLLEVLEKLDYRIIFTRPNADTNRDELNDILEEFIIRNKERSIAFESMGILNYLSAMKYCVGVVGNSSSGIYEAPSFKVGTINIGDRQKGRIKANSVIDCDPKKEDIIRAFIELESEEFKRKLENVKNPYEGVNTSLRIVDEIYKFLLEENRLIKKFYDL